MNYDSPAYDDLQEHKAADWQQDDPLERYDAADERAWDYVQSTRAVGGPVRDPKSPWFVRGGGL